MSALRPLSIRPRRALALPRGQSLPDAAWRRLFERFFRTSTAIDLAIQGTGLGLAIAKAITEAHRGQISFASYEGHGTTFRVELPLRDAAARVEREPTKTSAKTTA